MCVGQRDAVTLKWHARVARRGCRQSGAQGTWGVPTVTARSTDVECRHAFQRARLCKGRVLLQCCCQCQHVSLQRHSALTAVLHVFRDFRQDQFVYGVPPLARPERAPLQQPVLNRRICLFALLPPHICPQQQLQHHPHATIRCLVCLSQGRQGRRRPYSPPQAVPTAHHGAPVRHPDSTADVCE